MVDNDTGFVMQGYLYCNINIKNVNNIYYYYVSTILFQYL